MDETVGKYLNKGIELDKGILEYVGIQFPVVENTLDHLVAVQAMKRYLRHIEAEIDRKNKELAALE